MILGVGIDVVEISRIQKSIQDFPDSFIARIACPNEIKIVEEKKLSKQRLSQYWAGRFAAKEAFSKALGTGIGAHCALHDLSVINNELGAPEIIVSEKLQTLLNQRQIRKIHLSISHTDTIATAIVILS